MVSPTQIDKKIDPNLREIKFEEGTSLFADSMRKFRKNKMAVFSCFVLVSLFLISIFARFITPYTYHEGLLEAQNFPPTWYQEFITPSHKEKLQKWVIAETQPDAATQMATGSTTENTSNDYEGELNLESEDGTTQPIGEEFFDRSVNHLDSKAVAIYMAKGTWAHLLGTDELGQDIFSRLIYGIRLSLFLALTVTVVSLVIGISYGSISGYFGGALDQVMMRVVDFLFGVPFIFLIILLMVLFGRHVFLIFIGLGLVYWIVLARIVRGQILSLKEKEFVMAAHSNGVSQMKIIFKHLVPNVMGPIIIFSTLLVPQIMLLEAFLSFIGLGVTPPDVSLGIMISDGATVLSSYSWPIIFPGIIFSVMIFCMNFIGDGLRDALDPKFK